VAVVVLGLVLRVGAAGGWDAPPRTPFGHTVDAWRSRAGAQIHRIIRSPQAAGRPRPVAGATSRLGGRDRIVGIALIMLLSVAVITSHQLSPVSLLLDLIVLVAFTGWRRLWPVIGAIAVCEIGWVLLAWPTISKFGLFTIDGAVTPAVSRGAPLAGVTIVQDVSRAIGIAFGLLAVTGVVRVLRRVGGDPATPVAAGAFALSPYLIIPVQSYGGEAALRGYLFSLPWLALLSLEAIWPSGARVGSKLGAPATRAGPLRGPQADPRRRAGLQGIRSQPWLLAIVAPVLAAGLLVAYFGYALSNEMTTSDVAAATWVEQNVPAAPKAIVFLFSPSLPNRLTARYPAINYYGLTLSTEPAAVAGMQVPGQRAAAVRRALDATGARTVFLVFTPSMGNYDRLNGLFPQSQINLVENDLRATPDFKVVYDHDGSIVFRRAR
jgi:hypothetical protein